MICPECQKEGKKSCVHTDNVIARCAVHYRYDNFRDEEGKEHIHDYEPRWTDYKCSNGHEFRRDHNRVCPTCGWVLGMDK